MLAEKTAVTAKSLPQRTDGPPLVLFPPLEPITSQLSTDRQKMMLSEDSTTSCTSRPKRGQEHLEVAGGGNTPSLPPSLTPVPVEEGGRNRT